jgi:hypothetical protein
MTGERTNLIEGTRLGPKPGAILKPGKKNNKTIYKLT